MHLPRAVLFLLLCISSLLPAQSDLRNHAQVYGGYSFLSNSIDGFPGSHHGLNGWNAAFAGPAWHGVRFRADFSGYRGTNLGAPQHPYYIFGGAQYGWQIRRETVFAEASVGEGGANKSWAPNGAVGQTASFASLIGGGLDTPIRRHLAFRAEGGYQYSYFSLIGALNAPYRVSGLPTNFARISSGLVWQF